MNEALKEQAQIEYQRQLNLWLSSQPVKTDVYNHYAKLEKYFKKYKTSSKCSLKIIECMGGECTSHYKCQICNKYHMHGSIKKENSKK